MNEWISVQESLPENSDYVLIAVDAPCGNWNKYTTAGRYYSFSNKWYGYMVEPDKEFGRHTVFPEGKVTHWMPIPKAPGWKDTEEEKLEDYEKYRRSLHRLMEKMCMELEMKKKETEDIDAFLDDFAQYAEKLNLLSGLKEIYDLLDFKDFPINPGIPMEDIEYLLSDNVNAIQEIYTHAGWCMTKSSLDRFKAGAVDGIKNACSDLRKNSAVP